MAIDPRLPVLVGAAQCKQRVPVAEALEPVALMAQALEDAARDSGSTRLLADLDLIAVVRGAWNYSDPARLLAERVGARNARTALTAEGGNAPQSALNELCRRIAAGQLDVGAVVGGEGIYTRRKARETGAERSVTRQSGVDPDEAFGEDIPMSSAHEESRGLTAPLHFYALFENALRARRGESLDGHRDRIAALLCRFNAVAAENPYAWLPERLTVEQIRDVAADNPMAAYPYTKRMCSNWFTDQAAAVVVCSVAAAERLGVPRDQWVFPLSGTDGKDTQFVTDRLSLSHSPAIRVAGGAAVRLAGLGVDDLDHVDIYSCFPAAVQVAAEELGLTEDRPLTVTGGMAYFGGPLANYVTHSIATMAQVLRERGGRALVTANGGYLTKHAFGVYSAEPPVSGGFRSESVQAEIDALPRRRGAPDHVGPVTVEATTVVHEKGTPVRAVVACLTDAGDRVWGASTDPGLLDAATVEELAGRAAEVAGDGTLELR